MIPETIRKATGRDPGHRQQHRRPGTRPGVPGDPETARKADILLTGDPGKDGSRRRAPAARWPGEPGWIRTGAGRKFAMRTDFRKLFDDSIKKNLFRVLQRRILAGF